MLRLPVFKAINHVNGWLRTACIHGLNIKQQQSQPISDLIELFINDKPVQVPPGTTVLKVKLYQSSNF